jgi:hypothetical protein
MKVFHCDRCDHLLFFENTQCVACGDRVGFDPDRWDMVSVPAEATAATSPRRRCRNDVDFDVCNWTVPGDSPQPLCRACQLTTVIPDTTVPVNVTAWYRLEIAKRRLLFTLLSLGLPVVARGDDPHSGLAFEFRSDPDDPSAPRVLTGHTGGVITLSLAEADDAERERRRTGLGEPYRTLLGHMRHESGHYYWDRLIRDNPEEHSSFRALFGDEQADYSQALTQHYNQGPPPDWQQRFVSAYASSHPWEDWAETWAHYLHMADTLETAADNGLALKPRRRDEPAMKAIPADVVTSGKAPFDILIDRWFPLTYALNNLNRGLGLPDGYPFVLSQPSIDKLRFVHDVVSRAAAPAAPLHAGVSTGTRQAPAR